MDMPGEQPASVSQSLVPDEQPHFMSQSLVPDEQANVMSQSLVDTSTNNSDTHSPRHHVSLCHQSVHV